MGLIGNGQFSALVRRDGSVAWCCLPRFDSEPVFGELLDPFGGSFAISPANLAPGQQRYIENTNVLETVFSSPEGSFRVVDFAPRFVVHQRSYRPTKIVRIVEPIEGTPRIRVRCAPVNGWSKERPSEEFGSHHISYHGFGTEVRLTTDAPLSYLNGEPFAVAERKHFVFSWGAPVEEPLGPLCQRFQDETIRFWRHWVRECDIPPHYQDRVIRSALALKLHCFEDTGAIIASHTTSIPESPDSGRTWDYRYCWLRDAFYTLGAFRLLGHFEEREQFTQYLLNVASGSPDLDLRPLYRIDGRSDLEERSEANWAGYLGHAPVRVGNQAAEHRQYDVFGEMVLALTPLFLDARFRDRATPAVLSLVERLTEKAILVAGQPDAGIWEYRKKWRPQTFSSLMSWAAADRMSRIADVHAPGTAARYRQAAAALQSSILSTCVDPQRRTLVAAPGDLEVDASLLQVITLGLVGASSPEAARTIEAIRSDLELGGLLQRYRTDDGFGRPSVAFTLCSFWLVEALSRVGRVEEARALMNRIEQIQAPLGLLSEDVDPLTNQMWGNFPQAYSHVGMIHAAFAASPRWSDVA